MSFPKSRRNKSMAHCVDVSDVSGFAKFKKIPKIQTNFVSGSRFHSEKIVIVKNCANIVL